MCSAGVSSYYLLLMLIFQKTIPKVLQQTCSQVDSISHEATIKQTSQLTWNFHSLFSACEIFNLSHMCLMLSVDDTEPEVCLGMCQISSTEQKMQQ